MHRFSYQFIYWLSPLIFIYFLHIIAKAKYYQKKVDIQKFYTNVR